MKLHFPLKGNALEMYYMPIYSKLIMITLETTVCEDWKMMMFWVWKNSVFELDLGMVVHTCDSSTQEAEARGSQVQG
jgi:hypothetical protein